MEHLPLPFPVAGAVRVHNQAQFHPLKFVCCLAKGLHIYEHTPVRELIGTTAVTDSGKVAAKAVIVATHFPFLNKHGSYFLKLYQHRSYVIALENAPDVDGMYVDEAPVSYTHLDVYKRQAIDCFLKRIGLWINFRELNVTKEDIREIADCGQVLGDYANNPRVATIPEMYELLMSCYDRK